MRFPLFLPPKAQTGEVLPSAPFVRQMHILLGAGVTWDRLQPDLRAAFLLGYYLGNVRNGGHSQFIGNARSFYDGDPLQFLEWARAQAQVYGLVETVGVVEGVMEWIKANPNEAARQRGYTPYVSPALKPFNTALFKADLLDEKDWLARVRSLPGRLPETYLRQCSYDKGYVRFPAPFSEIEELRFLAQFSPVETVAEEALEDSVRLRARAAP